MTLQTQIATDASAVFLDTSDFAQSITHYPLGIVADAATITAIVDLDDETGMNQAPPVDNQFGSEVVCIGYLEVLSTLTITCGERKNTRDTFLIGTEIWGAYRVMARDGISGLQRVCIERSETSATKRSRVDAR